MVLLLLRLAIDVVVVVVVVAAAAVAIVVYYLLIYNRCRVHPHLFTVCVYHQPPLGPKLGLRR
jgi:hypothetical protein